MSSRYVSSEVLGRLTSGIQIISLVSNERYYEKRTAPTKESKSHDALPMTKARLAQFRDYKAVLK